MKCVISCPVRNVENYLNYTLNNIENISRNFQEFIVIFFYDNSTDNTLSIIKKFQNLHEDKGNIIIIENTEPLSKYRTHRIANARNKILEYIEINHSNTDFFILLDCGDECAYKVNCDILNKYLLRDDWDALFFNREGLPCGNYDIWALQFDNFIQNCWSFSKPIEIINIMKNELELKLKNLNENNLLEVLSAFNGFGIYRPNKFFGLRYDASIERFFPNIELEKMLEYIRNTYNLDTVINENCEENCEHIGFHINAINKNNAKIRMTNECIFEVVNNKKVQIYISNIFSKYYLPFLLYRNILFFISQKYLTTNIEYIYNIEDFDNNKDTILIMNVYCLTYTIEHNVLEIIKNSNATILLINTEYYKHHSVSNLLNIINENKLNFYFMEYNIINYNFIKENYPNVNLYFSPLLYHSYLEIYYKDQIDNKFISWNNKDIDVLFVGRKNERRMKILDEISKKYKVHIISDYTGDNENKNICSHYERSKIVINILYEDENSIFDYYRNTFLISNKILVVSEKPKNINFEIENYLNGYEHILFVAEYDNFYNIVDNILKNYNENKINKIKEKQYKWFKSVNDMDNYKNFFLKKFWFNYTN
jgi:hypothetical protein